MISNSFRCLLTAMVLSLVSVASAQLSDSDRPVYAAKLATLKHEINQLPATKVRCDAELFVKGLDWALRWNEPLDASERKTLDWAIARAGERIQKLSKGAAPWEKAKGRLVLAYRSAVDDSVQPYGLVVPPNYDGKTPIRLDVVLHGSTRPKGIFELRYMQGFDGGDGERSLAPETPYIELWPVGRVENCYRWSGETDVYEAIEDVCRRYKIDRSKIVLRGMSMGASGTWHLGLKRPSYFAALGPYCGYVDTHRFSETPGMNFVKVGPLPEYQELGLHMLDSVDYAANGGMVPAIGAIGEKDIFFDAHVIMGDAYRKEGVPFVNLISPGTGHVQEPKTWGEQMRQIGEKCDAVSAAGPDHIRFVTWTLKYAECNWVKLQALKNHYHRAEFRADRSRDGSIAVTMTENIHRFAILPPALQSAGSQITINGKSITLPRIRPAEGLVFTEDRGWSFAGGLYERALTGKRPGLQGPIDDAFTSRFLCVIGTGKAWSPAVTAWAEAHRKRFMYEYARYFRGDVPVKKDTEVTLDDIRSCNLILFGDPGSNSIIRRALGGLPIKWGEKKFTLRGKTYQTEDSVPAFICANPLPGGSEHYLVINSGHTFHEAELNRLNYLLFPRLGDYAVFKVQPTQPSDVTLPLAESLLTAGYFGEDWK